MMWKMSWRIKIIMVSHLDISSVKCYLGYYGQAFTVQFSGRCYLILLTVMNPDLGRNGILGMT